MNGSDARIFEDTLVSYKSSIDICAVRFAMHVRFILFDQPAAHSEWR